MRTITAKTVAPTRPRGIASPSVILTALALTVASMGQALATDEIHIITRDSIGDFISSHRLYEDKRRSVAEVTYCGRTYYAYPSTVKWTETAGAKGYRIALEHTDGTSWKVICRNPQEQVRYTDLDLSKLVKPKKPGARTKGGNWIDVIVQRRAQARARKN